MYYYEVLVGDLQYHGKDALTYSHNDLIPVGAIVVIGLRGRQVLGVVSKQVQRPEFTANPISKYVSENSQLPPQSLTLMRWLREYYPAPHGAVVRQFLPPSTSFPKKTIPITTTKAAASALPPLTLEQKNALMNIATKGLSILHGATGTGKTRVYLELTKQALKNNTSAIILTPEIGLTAQLVETFEAQFGGLVRVFHSQLTTAKRRDLWYQILNSSGPLVIIGPRSALFTPLKSIGLIVIDEAHEPAYKNESAPNYLSSRVAAKLAMMHHSKLVMGSATPLVEDYYFAQQKQRPIIRMTKPATQLADTKAKLTIVDMKDRAAFGRNSTISTVLQKALGAALDRKEQSLLFLNRRGTAKIVLCSNCGWQALCPHCDLPLTYHGDQYLLRCHICNFHETPPSSCPTCGGADILLKSSGTKAVTAEIQRLFPSAVVQRFDTDSTKEDRLEQNMSALRSGQIDIVVGTQVVAKGLDLPKLSVVGVLNADTSLWIPDYTAAERTYQLVSQVIGRVGRGHRKGKAIIQTYSPDSTSLAASVNSNWDEFYTHEIEERSQYLFPPFCYLLRLSCSRSTTRSAQDASQTLAEKIRNQHPAVIVEGPSPAFHAKQQDKYSWQLILKAKQRTELVRIIGELPSGWSYDIDPINLL